MVKQIKWEHWSEEDILNKEEELSYIEEEDFEESFAPELGINLSLTSNKIKTPLGIYNRDDFDRPGLMFKDKCWIGHTNFDITREIYTEIESSPGVEAFRVLSRYRFFIGIGALFDFTSVASNIEQTITKKGKIIKSIFYKEDGQLKYLSSDKKGLKKFLETVEKLKKENVSIINMI